VAHITSSCSLEILQHNIAQAGSSSCMLLGIFGRARGGCPCSQPVMQHGSHGCCKSPFRFVHAGAGPSHIVVHGTKCFACG